MGFARWLTNPVFVFIFTLIASGTSLFLYIRSYLEVNNAFAEFVLKRNLEPSKFLETETWVMILALSLLVSIILGGLLIIFVYYQKMIQLYRMQQNFINGFTHELKTPIASMKLFLDTFSMYELPRDEQLKYIGYMKRDAERLSENVNEILNLAKIEDKKYEAVFLETDVKEFVRAWIEKSTYLREECEIEIIDNTDTEIRLNFEPTLMEMLLSNLITNSVNYKSSAFPKVVITFGKQGEDFILQFKDNGIGIVKAEQKKIFKKFYQIGKTAKGSGLGLYLVQHITKIHNGKIRVYSEGTGYGTTFILSFPGVKNG